MTRKSMSPSRSDVVERDDVGVIQRRGGSRLLQEATLGIVATNCVARKHFDGDGPMQPRIAGAVDLAHASCAKDGLNLVRTEARAWRDGHRSGWTLSQRTAFSFERLDNGLRRTLRGQFLQSLFGDAGHPPEHHPREE